MARVESLTQTDMSPELHQLYRDIAGTRQRVGGPFSVWLRNPALADGANRFANALRATGKLDKRLFEIAVLLVTRHWKAQYAFFVHEDHAAAAGVSTDVIAAIRERKMPKFTRDDERLVYDVVTELFEPKPLSQATYDRALKAFGLDRTIELISTAGFYTMISMVLNGFDVPVPEGGEPKLK